MDLNQFTDKYISVRFVDGSLIIGYLKVDFPEKQDFYVRQDNGDEFYLQESNICYVRVRKV
jgi:hypothetical protein